MDYHKIITNIEASKFAPVYLLMGEESYFIDQICETLLAKVVPDDFKDFNQVILYGLDTSVEDIVNHCRKFPMIGEKQIVMVKEAQSLAKIDDLKLYLDNILDSTILVLAYKYGTVDGRKKLDAKIAEKGGAVFTANKIKEKDLPAYIETMVKNMGLTIEPKAISMLAMLLGNDLKRLMQQLEKLGIALSDTSQKRITAQMIEENVGLNREYNIFELVNAVSRRDFSKAIVIADYFDQNPKKNPLILTLAMLFKYFSTLLICYWAKDKSREGLKKELGLKWDVQVEDYQQGLKKYDAYKSLEIISLLRVYDGYCKGFGRDSVDQGLLLKELLYKIMH